MMGLKIAVIGIAGRFPGAKNVEEFWENLKNGVESISFISEEELEDSGIERELIQNPNYVKASGFLEDIECFDADFFGITPRDAEVMDPQIRLFHECTWEALENAGYDPANYKGLVGVYAGASDNMGWKARTLFGSIGGEDPFSLALFNNKDFLSLRLSYNLNLKGPSLTLYTSCSTALVAIHLACRGLIGGECDMAIAGGVSILVPQGKGYIYQEKMLASKDGHVRAFDSSASGTVFGSGIGVVILKVLEDAVEERDHIYAVIKGSAINNDGDRKIGFTAPSVQGQVEVINAAHQIAMVEIESIGYIETHGTGTILGDPIEIKALKQVFGIDKKIRCPIGSVKSNVGHLDSAAGIVGFIKSVLTIMHKQIPPTLHFQSPNPELELEDGPFYVNTTLEEWKRGKYPLRAGITSLGIGGTNAYLILEEVLKKKNFTPERRVKLILLSARTEFALLQIAENLVNFLKKRPGISLADVAYTLQVGRRRFLYRKMFTCTDVPEAISWLSDNHLQKLRVYSDNVDNGDIPVIFMFPGQGTQYINMGMELYNSELFFRSELERCFKILDSLTENNFKDTLYPDHPDEGDCFSGDRINQTEFTQPLLFIFEYALSRMLMKWGITPYAMIGHSIGEYVAACLSGVLKLEDALRLVVLRGKLMQGLKNGSMLSVPISEKELIPLLSDDISLAAVNGPSACVVSGGDEAIDTFTEQIRGRGYKSSRLHTSHAFHSTLMEPILTEFEKAVQHTEMGKPNIPYISNLTGGWISDKELKNPGYWAMHLRRTVRFYEGIKKLVIDKSPIFIEVGPGKTLSTLVRQHNQKKLKHQVLDLIRHPKENIPDDLYLFNKIGQLWQYGVNIDWISFNKGEERNRIPMPTYPFERKRFWIDGNPMEKAAKILSGKPSLKKRPFIEDWFYVPVWKQLWLKPSKIDKISAEEVILLFMDMGGIGLKLEKKFAEEGRKVITVKIGAEFKKETDSGYLIDPVQNEHYDRLFQELDDSQSMPGTIIHLWTLNTRENPAIEPACVTRTQELGFYSLFFIVQSIEKINNTGGVRLKIVTDNIFEVVGDEILRPEKATVLGIVKVAQKEIPNLSCSCIDVVFPDAGSSNYEEFLYRFQMELLVDSPDYIVAFRGGYRWIQQFEPMSLERSSDLSSRLRKKGVYLITGGLGGIGLVLGEYLANTAHARLILTGRTSMPEREDWQQWLEKHDPEDPISCKIRKIRSLEEMGAEVLVMSADTADLEQMREVITGAEKKFGQINGVIHAAGLADGALIQRRGVDSCERVLESKLNGTFVLDTILKDVEIDFFVLCSSLGSIVFQVGQVAYSAANNFLDAYSYYKNRQNGIYTVSINWDSWQEVGMAVETIKQFTGTGNDMDIQLALKDGILPPEGKEAFSRILKASFPQVAVSTRDLNFMIKELNTPLVAESKRARPSSGIAPSRNFRKSSNLKRTFVSPKNSLEKIIAGIWQQVLGVEELGINDNFFEIGGDSIKIIEVNAELQKVLRKEIPVQALFSNSTIRSLSEHLSQHQKVDELRKDSLENYGQRAAALEDARTRMKGSIDKFRRRKNE